MGLASGFARGGLTNTTGRATTTKTKVSKPASSIGGNTTYRPPSKPAVKTKPASTVGMTYSSYDNAYHPASWYAPKKPAALKPIAKVVAPKPATPIRPTPDGGSTSPATAMRKVSPSKPVAQKSIAKQTTYKPKGAAELMRTNPKGGAAKPNGAATRKSIARNSNANVAIVRRAAQAAAKKAAATKKTVAAAKPAVVPPKKVAAVPPKKAPPKKVAVPPKKAPAKLHVSKGYGRAGKFKTRRPTGPLHSLSVTPDMLQRISQQKFVRYS